MTAPGADAAAAQDGLDALNIPYAAGWMDDFKRRSPQLAHTSDVCVASMREHGFSMLFYIDDGCAVRGLRVALTSFAPRTATSVPAHEQSSWLTLWRGCWVSCGACERMLIASDDNSRVLNAERGLLESYCVACRIGARKQRWNDIADASANK